jgi:hypothetical protein
MTIQTEKTIGYALAVVLFVVGLLCYTALAKKPPEDPLRIMFKSTGGKVFFDHKTHFSDAGYALECDVCHHMLESKGEKPSSCGECHLEDGEDAPKRSDALHTQCIDCHEESGGGPTKCDSCHMR